MSHHEQSYQLLVESLGARGVDVAVVKDALQRQHIETPSWAYADTGTRFKTYAWPGAARTAWEKMDDAATVHKFTGVAPSVAIHIPWDKVDDFNELKGYAEARGVAIGAVNPNVFQGDEYKFGAICNPDPSIREMALDHMIECCDIMRAVDSDVLSLWFSDGTNFPGQDSIRGRKQRMYETLAGVYRHLPDGGRMLIEYKFFEPTFYHTDLADWGASYAMALKLGPQAQVLVDTGHHAQGANIEHIVTFLLDEGRLGGFHFNNRKYADDDLMVGSINPFELFLIFNELVDAEQSGEEPAAETARNVAYMLDQCHYLEPKVEAVIQSVVNCQIAYAKALIVNRQELRERQLNTDVLGAHRCLTQAYETDVNPLLAQVRMEMGLDSDPIAAYKASGYADKIAQERGVAAGGGGGFPSAD